MKSEAQLRALSPDQLITELRTATLAWQRAWDDTYANIQDRDFEVDRMKNDYLVEAMAYHDRIQDIVVKRLETYEQIRKVIAR